MDTVDVRRLERSFVIRFDYWNQGVPAPRTLTWKDVATVLTPRRSMNNEGREGRGEFVAVADALTVDVAEQFGALGGVL